MYLAETERIERNKEEIKFAFISRVKTRLRLSPGNSFSREDSKFLVAGTEVDFYFVISGRRAD